MNKAQLIEAASEKAGLSKKDTESALSAILEVIVTAVAGGDRVAVPGFGAFATRERLARTGLRPGTTEKMEIPAATVVRFAPATGFKEAVNK